MNKQSFLNSKDVKDFSSWLQANLDTENSFSHQFEMETKGSGKATKPWCCNSIFDAYSKYNWNFTYSDRFSGEKKRGDTYKENEAALSFFSNGLRHSLETKNHDDCYKFCEMILDWGGVLNGNKDRLVELGGDLVDYLVACKKYFESQQCSLQRSYTVNVNNKSRKIIMTAGFTKIYALLCDNFIIYDGRVGAALGLIVRTYLESIGNKVIPENLNFYYGKAKNSKVNRNPSSGAFQFKALSSSAPVHIRNNLKANWLLSEVIANSGSLFGSQKKPMRSFEAALFMIGYRVPGPEIIS